MALYLGSDKVTEIINNPRIDISKIQNFSYFFLNSRLLDQVDFSQFNTIKCNNVVSMFNGCASLKSVPQLDTSKATDFSYMFNGCRALQSVPQFDMSKATNVSYMFFQCNIGLKSVPQLNTSKAANFSYMFSQCTNLTSISQLDISNGTNFNSTFSSCGSLQSISLTKSKSDFVTSTFNGCYALTNIIIGEGWNTSIYLHYSNRLTQECLHKMIENLADLTGQTAKIFRIGTTNIAKIDEEHITMLQSKNWNYS